MSGGDGGYAATGAGDGELELRDHLAELLVRVRRIAVAVLVASVVVSMIPVDTRVYVPLISVLPEKMIDHVLPDVVEWRGRVYEVKVAQFSPFGAFNVLLKTALALGFLAASPYVAYQLYAYAAPGLTPEERGRVKALAAAAVGLFALGAVAAYLYILPFAFRIMIIFSVAVVGEHYLVAFSDVERLFSTIVLIIVMTGVAFEAPLIVYLLVYHGAISPDWFKGENRKLVYIASLGLGALVSPDPSGVGMLVVGTLMYAAIMAAARLAERHRQRRLEREAEEILAQTRGPPQPAAPRSP